MSSTNDEPPKEAADLLRIATGFVSSQVLYLAADLGIADHLAHGALTAQDLAARTSTHADALARLLRALVGFGILKCDSDGKFLLTATGEFLQSDVPGSQRAVVRFAAGPWFWRAYENLGHSIRTGEAAFDHVWGMSNFEYWKRHPAVSTIHDEAMEGITALETARVLASYDFSQFARIADVGGGNAAFLAALLRQNPKLSGTVADLPHVVSLASGVLQKAGVADRCQVVGCDFFETVPAGAGAYVLKHIIHDWDDRRASIILKNCHRSMDASAKLLILDTVLPPQPAPEAARAYLADLTMLIGSPGGRERTQEEFRELLESAGFELIRVIRTGSFCDIIEAQKRT